MLHPKVEEGWRYKHWTSEHGMNKGINAQGQPIEVANAKGEE